MWLWTQAPGAIAAVAAPIGKPYFTTGSPGSIGRTAILWPAGTSLRSTSPESSTTTSLPAASGRTATTTLSAGWILTAWGAAVTA